MPGLLPNVDPDGLLEYSVVYTDRSINHMSQSFRDVMNDISQSLKSVYNATAVSIVPGSGTFGMEAVARQFATDKKCLVIRNGWFSYRWSQIFEMGGIPNEEIVLKARMLEDATQAPFTPAPLDEVVGTIEAEKPDLVALQEVDRETRRSSGVDQAAELGRLTGMTAVYGPAMPYQGGEYGDAVLSRLRPTDSGYLPLPAAPHHEPRVAAFVIVPFAGGDLVFVGTHLDHTRDPADRVRQARTLVEHWPREEGANVILAGDLNAQPDS